MNEPICRECVHLHRVEDVAQCKASGTPEVDVVWGEQYYPKTADEMRTGLGAPCGPEGKLFERRVIWFGSQRPGEGE